MNIKINKIDTSDGELDRPSSSYDQLKELSSNFKVMHNNKPYQSQYASLYYLRLAHLKRLTQDRSKTKWSHLPGHTHKPRFYSRVLDVEQGQLSFLVGTVYIDMKLKPNVLDDLASNHWIAAPQPSRKMFSDQDDVSLEDESGRIRLVGSSIKKTRLITGIIIGVLGIEKDAGEFTVLDICYPGIPSQTNTDRMNEDYQQTPLVACISGLQLGSQDKHDELSRTLLINYLSSETRINRLIICGNCMSSPVEFKDDKKPRKFGQDQTQYSSLPATDFDSFLMSVSKYVDVEILPGPNDPAGTLLPQQSFPKAMFINTFRNSNDNVRCHTNPTWFSVDNSKFLITSGQTLDDSFRYIESEDRLGLAIDSLKWRHMAPTAPDTLWCYPFTDKDPFILTECPHVFVNGNQPQFETELVNGPENQQTRVILLPSFCDTGTIALIDPITLDCHAYTFAKGSEDNGHVKFDKDSQEVNQQSGKSDDKVDVKNENNSNNDNNNNKDDDEDLIPDDDFFDGEL